MSTLILIAGCDDLDSDGDGKVDKCEDRFAPEILIRDAKIFRCDRDNTLRLCYTDKWFQNATDAENFLEYEFAVSGKLKRPVRQMYTYWQKLTSNQT